MAFKCGAKTWSIGNYLVLSLQRVSCTILIQLDYIQYNRIRIVYEDRLRPRGNIQFEKKISLCSSAKNCSSLMVHSRFTTERLKTDKKTKQNRLSWC